MKVRINSFTAIFTVALHVGLAACVATDDVPKDTNATGGKADSDEPSNRFILRLAEQANYGDAILLELDPTNVSFDPLTFSASNSELVELLPLVLPFKDELGQRIWSTWGERWNTTHAFDIGDGHYCVFPSPESFEGFERFDDCRYWISVDVVMLRN